MNKHDGQQHSEKSNKNLQGETENMSASAASKAVTTELTLVLFGDRNSIEIEPNNLLLDHDQETYRKELSTSLCDLFGRHISLINMLGLPSLKKIPVFQEDHAFILLISNNLHDSQYTSGMQWLEQTFGKEQSSYVITVVTHDPYESCEWALQDLRAKSSFSEKRCHSCTRSFIDVNEIIALLKKIDDMVSENRQMTAGKGANQCEASSTAEETESDDEFEALYNSSHWERKIIPKETEKVFRRLQLHDKSQAKLSPAEFLQIGPPVKQSNDMYEKDLAHVFLQRLMMLDYRVRYIPVQIERLDVSHLQATQESENEDTDDDDFDDLFSTNMGAELSKENHVHPMDVQMAVFHSSDSFLRQKMITKLSQCQYALPLLVPDPVTRNIVCPLWTFRQITKTWKIVTLKDNSSTVTMKSMPIYKAETPMVSFFRLGSISSSKSQLMNSLINDRHNTFFHRNCPGSTKSRHLMDGVAEIAWYCPAGRPNDYFTNCIAFCNLHGDSLENIKQREILTEKSSVIVVLVPTLEKNHESSAVIEKLFKSSKPLIILIADSDSSAVQMKRQKYKLGLKDRSQSDVSEELKKIIRSILSGDDKTFNLESMADVSGVTVDEDEKVCQNGKSAAMEIVKMIGNMETAKIKDTFLPCQGQLWYEWCKINKELHNLKGDIEKEKGKKINQQMELRQKQCDVSNSELIRLFTQSLRSLPEEDRKYFLTWTQILVDALSTDDLSSILLDYDETWSKVLALKNKHDKSAERKYKQTELKMLLKKLQSATFGLEHIFREMGQIYEAHKSLQKASRYQHGGWTTYPELAADLLISGHPMELMDGDAGHVPLTWISSLFQEVIKKLGDRRVFVLSVLGVQSSGKSTMLNAMFGLQFAVGAGRCTKGAYMQLVKLSEEIKQDYKFDYILVVDTEGLRPPELEGDSTLHHDNELATFVVGLGNMTLINIFGENPADMQDVLQIVVQAFMRMKKVKISPSCVFVHQNVTDIAAAEKNMDGKRRLQEKLDKMAQLAAKEEECDTECFSDVIAFDVQKDVKYFAQLWEGSPPMAPPNPGYSECVQELKSFIMSKAQQSTGITLSQFSGKIQDLWNALMNENFVFSFKNTQEISVYRRLEVQYGKWTWKLRSEMLNIENQLYPSIEKGQLEEFELSDINEKMNETYKEVKTSMAAVFEDEKDKEMLVQWRGRFENRIKHFCEELVEGVKRKLNEIIKQNNARKMHDKKKTEFENKLLLKSKELAHMLKCTDVVEEELKQQFRFVWSQWVTELTLDTEPIKDLNLEKDLCAILQELCFEDHLIEESKNNRKYINMQLHGDYSHYILIKKRNKDLLQFWQRSGLSHQQQEMIRSFIIDVEKECLEAVKSKPVSTRGFTPTYLQEMAQNIKEKTETARFDGKFVFKKEFTVDLILYVFSRAERWLLDSHQIYKKNNDVLMYLESKEKEYYNIFRSIYKGSSSAVVFGEIMCEKLKASAAEAICNKTGVDIAGEMMSNFPAFNGNRLNLEKRVGISGRERRL